MIGSKVIALLKVSDNGIPLFDAVEVMDKIKANIGYSLEDNYLCRSLENNRSYVIRSHYIASFLNKVTESDKEHIKRECSRFKRQFVNNIKKYETEEEQQQEFQKAVAYFIDLGLTEKKAIEAAENQLRDKKNLKKK